MATRYQTLSGFLIAPFNKKNVEKDNTFNSKYRLFVSSNKIKVHATCIIEDSYYIHIKVPSESNKDKDYLYDVVIRFFTDNPEVLKQNSLRNYYIQFFSNSPSFMYQYAYLYNQEGFLIKALYDKLDADYIDIPPTKTNSEMIASYDKSIYFACRYLSENMFRYLNKKGHLLIKKVTKEKFFSNISDFKSVKFDQTLINEEKKLTNLVAQKAPRSLIGKAKAEISSKKIEAVRSTSSDKNKSSISYVKKTTGKNKITGVIKKTARYSSKR